VTVDLSRLRGGVAGDGVELQGMAVEALDGRVGKVDGVADGPDGTVVVVDTGLWILGKKVEIPAAAVSRVDTEQNTMWVDRTQEQIKAAPEHDPDRSRGADAGGGTDASGAGVTGAAALDAPATGDTDGTAEAADEETPDTSGTAPQALQHAAPVTSRETAESATGSPDAPVADTEDTGSSSQARVEETGHRTAGPAAAPSSAGQETKAPGRTTTRTGQKQKSGAGQRKQSGGRRTTGAADVPIARYESLTAAQVTARLPSLSQRELASVERHEQRNDGRKTVLRRISELRENEPWRGYDRQNVDEIRKKLAKADADRLRTVRDYERRHRDRAGVRDAVRRRLADA
jgi:hypothetical protein